MKKDFFVVILFMFLLVFSLMVLSYSEQEKMVYKDFLLKDTLSLEYLLSSDYDIYIFEKDEYLCLGLCEIPIKRFEIK